MSAIDPPGPFLRSYLRPRHSSRPNCPSGPVDKGTDRFSKVVASAQGLTSS